MSPNGASESRPNYVQAAEDLKHNPGQWQAYESTGNCVMLAGPGSGKTKALTIKIARMLEEDVAPPRGIACITFSNECVREIRNRLDALGVAGKRNLFIGTVHSFCLKHVVIPYGRMAGLGLPEPLSVASPSEQERLFQRALEKTIGANERPSSWKLRLDSYRRIHLNRDGGDRGSDDPQVAQLVIEYERLLREAKQVDFDDMTLSGLRVIEQFQWVRKALRARFPILVIDEYQDLGVPLHRLATCLRSRAGIRLLAVGDADQSIYGFSGAKPSLLRELSEAEDVQSVTLPFNYRCGSTIISASEVALGEKRGYESKTDDVGTIDFHHFPNGLEEQVDRTCDRIIPAALERRDGRSLGDVAILYRNKNIGNVIAGRVATWGYDFVRIDQGAPYQKTPMTRWLEECAAWCARGWQEGKPRLSHLIQTWMSFNRILHSEEQRRNAKVRLVGFLFSHRSPAPSLHEWLTGLVRDCLKEPLNRDETMRDEKDAVKKLWEASKEGGPLAKATVLTFGGQGGAPDHLNLITLHSSKGLEFDVVIMPGLEQGVFPAWNATETEKKESRRLFYVGITRAKHEVHLAYSGWYTNQYGRRFENGPSEFVEEMRAKLVESK